jgi:predicted acetyltransferase
VELSGGTATVTPASAADCRLDAGTLAAIYTGWLSARDARRTGRLTGATDRDVEILQLIFSGPKPWLIDVF